MEGNGGDVEMDAIKNDSGPDSVGNGDYAVGEEVLLDDSELHGRRMTDDFSPPPVWNRPARRSSGLPFMPTRYDRPPPFPFSQGYNVPEEVERVRREVEKKRIRDEIIAAGVAWRRSLEADVLRDLQVEGFGFPSFEHSRVPETNEEKLIALAKLDPGHYGVNRKDEDLLEVPSLPFPGVKKPKKELSCSLCNESSIGEKDLNSHLEGSKHQAKVAAVKAELAAKCCGTPLRRSNPANLDMAVGSDDIDVTPPANGVKRKAETLSEVPSLPCPCGSTPPMANKPANPSKLSFTAAGSERNGDFKCTPPAIEKADGSTACDAKSEAVQEHEKAEGAALDAMAAEAARRENVGKLFKKEGSKLNSESS